jgi:hypothetical protein
VTKNYVIGMICEIIFSWFINKWGWIITIIIIIIYMVLW